MRIAIKYSYLKDGAASQKSDRKMEVLPHKKNDKIVMSKQVKMHSQPEK